MSHRRIFRLLAALVLAALILAPASRLSAAPARQEALPAWLDAQEKGGIVYFLYASPDIIRRYDLAASAWLVDITLPGAPGVFRVDDALYVSIGGDIYRFALDGSAGEKISAVPSTVRSLLVGGDYLFIHYYGWYHDSIQSVRKTTGEFIVLKEYLYNFGGTVIAPGMRKIFGSSNSVSPTDTLSFLYNADGTLGEMRDSPYHGDYPVGWKHWISPSESILINNAGAMYATLDLTYRDRFMVIGYNTGPVQDVVFYGEQPVILVDRTIYGYSTDLILRGKILLEIKPERMFLYGGALVAFTNSEAGVIVQKIPLSRLNLPAPGAPVNPLGLAFLPESAAVGQGDILYLMSRKYQSIFRWDIAARRYIETIPLRQTPSYMAYMAANNALYIAYDDGQMTTIRLNESTAEQPFTVLPGRPWGLLAADEYLFAADWPRAWASSSYHNIFNAAGVLLSRVPASYSRDYAWNAANRKIFYLRDNSSPNDILWETIGADGAIGASVESPYHGSYSIAPPLRVNAPGTRALVGSGVMFDGAALTYLGTLTNAVNDAVWANETLYTARPTSVNTQVQLWNAAYTATVKTRELTGLPLRLLPFTGGLVALTNDYKKLRIYLLDMDLNVLASPPKAAFLMDPTSGDHPLQVTFTNTSTGGAEFAWDFGDGATSSEASPAHTYAFPGVYTVRLVVSGPGGQDGLIQEGLIQVNPLAVTFDAPARVGDIPLTVHFTSTVTGGPADTYLWDFGDGATSTEANPSHQYTTPGSFTVSLKVSGPGDEASHVEKAFIFVNPVTAAFQASTSFGAAPLRVQFTNQSTGGPFDSILWDFGDGSSSTDENPVHVYTERGSFTVTLTVSGIYGSDSVSAETPVQSVYGVYIPLASFPQYAKPGLYPFADMCQSFNLRGIGTMTECVRSIEVRQDGNMVFNYSWKSVRFPGIYGCVIKYPDTANRNMYVTDAANNRYDHFASGGAAGYIDCMEDGKEYAGWFLFPHARSDKTTFTFHDDDAPILLGPLAVPGN